MPGFIVFIVLVVILAIIISKVKKSGKKKKYKAESAKKPAASFYTDKKPAMDSSPEPFHASQKEEENHKITRIMMYEADKIGGSWTCEYCESENSNSFEKCSVCNHHR